MDDTCIGSVHGATLVSVITTAGAVEKVTAKFTVVDGQLKPPTGMVQDDVPLCIQTSLRRLQEADVSFVAIQSFVMTDATGAGRLA